MYGLQRAFHVAGTRNVIASLWKVDDQATVALMRLFYHKLLNDKLPPITALREAQLALYWHPEQITSISVSRGPKFEKVVKLVGGRPSKSNRKTTVTRHWAAFMLSGIGR